MPDITVSERAGIVIDSGFVSGERAALQLFQLDFDVDCGSLNIDCAP